MLAHVTSLFFFLAKKLAKQIAFLLGWWKIVSISTKAIQTYREDAVTIFRGLNFSGMLCRSIGILELFSNSPLRVFASFHEIQPPAWPSGEQSDLSRLEPDGPPWVSLALSAFGCLSWGPPFHLTVPRTIWSERTGSGQSPLACCKKLQNCLFRMVHVYCTFFISCILSIPTQIRFLSLFFSQAFT